MSVQIYDSSESDTSPLSTDEYDDDEDSDLMDMAVSVKPGSSASNNNISPSKVSTTTTASSSTTSNVKSTIKSGSAYKETEAAPRHMKKNQIKKKPQSLNAICKKRSLNWFKNGTKRDAVRLYLKEFYLNRIQKNGENIKVSSSVKSTSSAAAAAGEEEKVITDRKVSLGEELRYKLQLFRQQNQRAFIDNLQEQNQNQFALNEQQKQHQQQRKQEQQDRSMIEILKHVQNQERLQNKSPDLICLDVTEDEESPQKSEPSPLPSPSPINKVNKIPANNHLMQLKIIDIKASVDNIVICPDEEEEVVEVKTKMNSDKTPNIETTTTDINTYEHHEIPLLDYGPQQTTVSESIENNNVSAAEVIISINNDEAEFLDPAATSALSNVNIPGILDDDTEIVAVADADADAIVIQNDIIPMEIQIEPCVLAEPTPTTIEELPEQNQEQQKQQQQQQQMPFKLTSTPLFCNSTSILPHPPQVVTPMAHTPSPIRAPQTTATPQVAHMRLPIGVPSTHTTSIVTNSTPITTSIILPPPQIHASNMSVKRRRSETPEDNKIPTTAAKAATSAQQDTSKAQGQGEESSSNLPGDTGNTRKTDSDQQQASKKRMLDPTSNAAFYQRIIDLIPDYEEALSTHVQGATQTEEKLNEAIKRTSNDLIVLENVLKTKEEEWNKLLYLKRVQQELLERMVRMLKVAQAKRRGEMVHKYSLKQLQELEECLKISTSLSQPQLPPPPPQQPTEREKHPTEREPFELVNKMTQMINRLANMCPEDILAHAATIKTLKEQYLPNDKSHERWNNNNEATSSILLGETISKEEERIKLQRNEEIMHRKYMESRIQEEQRRSLYENQLRLEKQREIEHHRQLDEYYGKYQGGVSDEFLINKAKGVAELKPRHQQLPPPPIMVGRQGAFKDVKGIIDSFRRENPQPLPPPPLFNCTKPVKPETYVSNNINNTNNYANNYKATSMSAYDDIPTLKKLLSRGSGGGGGGVDFVQPRNTTREQYEHSDSGMASMSKPYRPKFDMRLSSLNSSYDDNLRVSSSSSSSSNPYKNTNRHSFGDLEYNRNNYGITNGGQLNDHNTDKCQECYKSEALFICGSCNKGRYCSRNCQVIAWDKHQDVCGE